MTSSLRDGVKSKTQPVRDTAISALDRPVPAGVNAAQFGSDVAADALRALDIPYIALNPGASYRGLHDSIVNYLGNERPQMLLCLHEESAVAIAHGSRPPSVEYVVELNAVHVAMSQRAVRSRPTID